MGVLGKRGGGNPGLLKTREEPGGSRELDPGAPGGSLKGGGLAGALTKWPWGGVGQLKMQKLHCFPH